MTGPINRFDHHIRTPRSKWDGAFKVIARGPEPFTARCDACDREVTITDNRCPDCRRFVARPAL